MLMLTFACADSLSSLSHFTPLTPGKICLSHEKKPQNNNFGSIVHSMQQQDRWEQKSQGVPLLPTDPQCGHCTNLRLVFSIKQKISS